jgi:hypothetical protein
MRSLFLSFPYNPAKISLARVQYARRRGGLDEELVALESKMPPLLSAIPRFIPRNIDKDNEILAFNAVSAAVREH